MLNYNLLNDEEYASLRYQLLVNVEETGNPKPISYLDSKGIPTVGIGFNLRSKNVLDGVLKAFGFDTLSALGSVERKYIDDIESIVNASYASKDALNTALNAVMSSRFNDSRVPAANRTRVDFQFLDDGEIRGVFDGLIRDYEDKVDTWLSGIPKSQERAVLASLAWNNAGKLLGPGLQRAMQSDNRAEAWYEIRYGSNGDKLAGIAKRRYYESELFSLYGDAVLDESQAKQIYAMYTSHREAILDYESKYSSQIDKANSDYHLTDNSSKPQTLENSLQEVADLLKQLYVPEALRSTINPLDIQLATDQQTDLSGGKRDGYKNNTGQDQNDLLVGNEQNNILNGLGGNDILIGGAGDDTLNGGTGNDTHTCGRPRLRHLHLQPR